MKMSFKSCVALAAVITVAAWSVTLRAADPSGRWAATFMTQVGEQVYTYDFTVKGTTLTGTAKGSLTGETKITDGKVDGDTITFVENATYQGMMITFTYTGKMTSADQLDLTREVMGQMEKATAKRAK
jgi:hypothetical protein